MHTLRHGSPGHAVLRSAGLWSGCLGTGSRAQVAVREASRMWGRRGPRRVHPWDGLPSQWPLPTAASPFSRALRMSLASATLRSRLSMRCPRTAFSSCFTWRQEQGWGRGDPRERVMTKSLLHPRNGLRDGCISTACSRLALPSFSSHWRRCGWGVCGLT